MTPDEIDQQSGNSSCKNCGRPIDPGADFCPRCGARQADAVAVAVGRTRQTKYCPNCGRLIDDAAEICPACGVRVPSPHRSAVPKAKYNRLTAALFALFLGGLGIHRFYLHQPGMGIGLIIMTVFGLLTCAFVVGWFLLVPMWIICVVDFVKYLSMSDEDWAAKYPA